MALTPSGQIAFSDINNEINVQTPMANTAKRAINDVYCRNLSGKSSSTALVSMSDFYGKAIIRQSISITFNTNTANGNVNISNLTDYIPGCSDITITIASGVYLYANNTNSNAGLKITGGTTGDTLKIINNGYIMGQGGHGGGTNVPSSERVGGPAIVLSLDATIDNTNPSAYIAGGGGSGGNPINWGGAGAGAGGGNAGNFYGANMALGGAPGQPGNRAPKLTTAQAGGSYPVGGAGGRIIPGDGGAGGTINGNYTGTQWWDNGYGAGAGGGGAAFTAASNINDVVSGGAGGSSTNAGDPAQYSYYVEAYGGGGGWGAQGGQTSRSGYFITYTPTVIPGNAGGKAVNTNGRTVTWVSGDTTRVYGAVG